MCRHPCSSSRRIRMQKTPRSLKNKTSREIQSRGLDRWFTSKTGKNRCDSKLSHESQKDISQFGSTWQLVLRQAQYERIFASSDPFEPACPELAAESKSRYTQSEAFVGRVLVAQPSIKVRHLATPSLVRWRAPGVHAYSCTTFAFHDVLGNDAVYGGSVHARRTTCRPGAPP